MAVILHANLPPKWQVNQRQWTAGEEKDQRLSDHISQAINYKFYIYIFFCVGSCKMLMHEQRSEQGQYKMGKLGRKMGR